MFERYNEKARRTIFFARYEASLFGTPEIESEHLLLGILREGKTAFCAILGLSNLESIRAEIEQASTRRDKISTSANLPLTVDLPLTNECKRILAYGAEEAERLRNKHIGIEHLLLGILREEKCLAATILNKQGVKLQKARKLIADGKEQLAAFTSERATAQVVEATADEVPATRRPVTIRVVITCESEVLLAYRSYFGPPRIGESILIRDAAGVAQTYRVQDVIWEADLDAAIVLREVNVRVVPEAAK